MDSRRVRVPPCTRIPMAVDIFPVSPRRVRAQVNMHSFGTKDTAKDESRMDRGAGTTERSRINPALRRLNPDKGTGRSSLGSLSKENGDVTECC